MTKVPNQRDTEYAHRAEIPTNVETPTRVITTTLVMIIRDESLDRVWYKGMTPDEVVDMLKNQPLEGNNGMIQEFVDDVQSKTAEDLFIVRTVKLR